VANLETLTSIALNADDTNIDYTDEAGNTTQLDLSNIVANLETLTNLVNNGDGTFTYTNEAGTSETINLVSGQANNDIQVAADGGLYLNVASVTISETITTLTDNADGTFTYESEDGTSTTITGTDDQNASEVAVTDTAGNFTATDVEGALAELATGSTDDQALTITGANILTLEDGGTVDLTPYLDNTDDQQITAFSLDNSTNILTITLEYGGTQTVDFTAVLAAAGTDDQALTITASNVLTLEDGGTVDLNPFLDNTDDQTATEVAVTDTAGNFTATDVEGALAELATGSTDDQALTITASNVLTLEDGGTVDLNPFLDNTDDQQITAFSLDNTTDVLTLTLEDGGTQTVDFTAVLAAAGTDDQTATEVAVTDTAGNFTATDVEGALAELATGSTDDQALTITGANILTLEDGGTVDLSPFL
ncbi:hypothetical protein, partial [Maribacter sp. 2307ULW6-5]|uniref:hypothetical protein n=1 Tax=Maribacter sp. 2307ULW6-5 TaxID=3386275 RepID=UPI0039BCAC6B